MTARQEVIVRGLVEAGFYANVSEVGRAAFERLFDGMRPAQRVKVAVVLYAKGELDLAGVAEVADIAIGEARKLVADVRRLERPRGRETPAARDLYRRRLDNPALEERLLRLGRLIAAGPEESLRAGLDLSAAAERSARRRRT
ncbi:MAG: hypothetical protein ACT4PT_03640 [Methanobacteriota archaeon]